MKMEEKTKNKKLFFIIEITVLALFLLMVAGCLISELAMPETPLANWMKTNIWDVSKTLVSLKTHVPVLINSLIYIVIVYAVCRIIRIIFSAKMKKSNRSKTVLSLLDGFVKYACAIAIIILILKACGVEQLHL